MNQSIITELVCIDCGANLMRDIAEDGALFDTAKGNGGTTASDPTGFDCPANSWVEADWNYRYEPHRIKD